MVDNGIVEKLMDLLDRHVEDGNVTVQHAALSALRNLAIPGKTSEWEPMRFILKVIYEMGCFETVVSVASLLAQMLLSRSQCNPIF